MMKFFARFLVAAAAALSAGAATAQNIQCDSFYTTREGDNLSRIAQAASRANGVAISYQNIVDFNTGKLLDPNLIPTGLRLFIPCPVGATPVNGATVDDPAFERAQGRPDIKILTGTDYPPYVDEGLPGGGGWSVHLVHEALQFSGQLNYRIDVIGDWSAHLRTLLADGAYDMAFPWFRPNCDKYDQLGDEARWRCDNLLFSEPLHQVVISYYVRAADAERITTEADLAGKRVCRPRGYFTHDLDVRGLTLERFQHVAADSPKDCFERLISGEVDVVALNAETSERMIDALNIENQVAEARRLATIESAHVVVMRTSADGRTLLLRFDQGLLGFRDSGADRDLLPLHLGAD